MLWSYKKPHDACCKWSINVSKCYRSVTAVSYQLAYFSVYEMVMPWHFFSLLFLHLMKPCQQKALLKL